MSEVSKQDLQDAVAELKTYIDQRFEALTEAYRPALRKSRDKFAFGISRLGALHGDPGAQLRIDGYRIRRAPGAREERISELERRKPQSQA